MRANVVGNSKYISIWSICVLQMVHACHVQDGDRHTSLQEGKRQQCLFMVCFSLATAVASGEAHESLHEPGSTVGSALIRSRENKNRNRNQSSESRYLEGYSAVGGARRGINQPQLSPSWDRVGWREMIVWAE